MVPEDAWRIHPPAQSRTRNLAGTRDPSDEEHDGGGGSLEVSGQSPVAAEPGELSREAD